jgi:hypothetical protein
MSVIVSSGGRHVVASGETFLFAPNSDLSIDIDEGELRLKLTMRFLQDNARDLSIEYQLIDGRLFAFCYNFSPEAGLIEPRVIQETCNHRVYLMLRYFEAGRYGRIRSVKYTIFAEQKDG